MKNFDWYSEFIEQPVREIVKNLRDQGINTTCSCGHEMTIQCEYYGNNELSVIYTALVQLGVNNFNTVVIDLVKDGYRNTFIMIMLPDKNGNYVCNSITDNENFIKNKLNPKP